MSRAVVTCSGSGRPEALRNSVAVMPSSRALRVMSSANRSSLPAMCSATATATSLADLMISALMASIDRRSRRPPPPPAWTAAADAALAEKRILVRVAEPALLDQLEQQIERHQLGERGREAQLVGGALVEHAAGIGVDHQHGVPARDLRLGRRQQALSRERQRQRPRCRGGARDRCHGRCQRAGRPFPLPDALCGVAARRSPGAWECPCLAFSVILGRL